MSLLAKPGAELPGRETGARINAKCQAGPSGNRARPDAGRQPARVFRFRRPFPGRAAERRGVAADRSDLLLGRADGTFQQDVRLLLTADDGGLILMTYRGVRRSSPVVDERLARGEAVDPSEYYLRTTPYFETAAPPHAWLNQIVAVAQGGRRAGGVEYDVFEVL
ncbi:hypothetical protein FHT92_001965 [Rhizobium sp. BK377]|nr:hypothetical protein [Rhizobium sp. BK377]